MQPDMKPFRFTAIIFLLFLTTHLFSQKVQLTFDVKGLPDGYCRLIGVLGSTNYLVDTFPSLNGKAQYFKDELLPGGLYYFVFPDQRTFFQLLLDKEQKFTMKSETDDLVGKMTISGSVDNTLFYDNQRFESKFRTKVDSIEAAMKLLDKSSLQHSLLTIRRDSLVKARKDYLEQLKQNYPNSFFTYFKLSGQNPDLKYPKHSDGSLDTVRQTQLYRDEYWNNTNIADERLLRTPVIANKLKTYITQLTPQTSDSIIKYIDPLIEKSKSCPECYRFVVNWIAIQHEKPTFMGGEKVLVHLVDKYFTDEIADLWFKETPYELTKIRLKVNSMRPSLVGNIGQDINCKNDKGTFENLYTLKTPIQILFMYSPDCSHCQEEAPQMVELMNKWKGKLDIYALCLDDDESKWRQFISKYKIEQFHNVIDPKKESLYYKKYHIDITPEIYVMDTNHKIIAKDLHPNQLEPVFKQILDKAGIPHE